MFCGGRVALSDEAEMLCAALLPNEVERQEGNPIMHSRQHRARENLTAVMCLSLGSVSLDPISNHT